MKKVLLSHSYFYPLDKKQWENKTPFPPLATIYASSYLKKLGFEVSLYDTNLRSETNDLQDLISKNKFDYFIIYDDGFNYLSKMCLTNMRDAAMQMIQLAKQLGAKVIVSSSDASDHYEKYLNKSADIVIIGEGEITLGEVLMTWEQNKSIESISGIAFKKENNIIKTPPRTVLRDLDSLPLPEWDLVDIDSYKKVWNDGGKEFMLNLATTRGCPYKCNWCAKPIYGNRYNSRSPQNVIQEIEILKEKYNVSKFWMCDDIFGLKPGWVKEFNTLLKEKNINITYKIQTRVDLLLQDNTIKELAESGLYEAWVGAESGSQKILDAMDKGTTIEEINKATTLLQQNNVRVGYFLQFGYLGETKEDIEATIAMVKKNNPDDIGVSVSYPLPGTKFFETVKTDLGSKTNWSDSDELAMMFKGSFNSKFYKILHRYIHRIFRIQQGKQKLFNKSKRSKQIESKWIYLLPANYILSLFYQLRLQFLNNKANP